MRGESAAQRRAVTRIGMINSQQSCAMIGEARYATGTEARTITATDKPITSDPGTSRAFGLTMNSSTAVRRRPRAQEARPMLMTAL